jgi:hypothetical protein
MAMGCSGCSTRLPTVCSAMTVDGAASIWVCTHTVPMAGLQRVTGLRTGLSARERLIIDQDIQFSQEGFQFFVINRAWEPSA